MVAGGETDSGPEQTAEGSLGRVMKCTLLENLSITVRMVVLPSNGGNPVMKSNECPTRVCGAQARGVGDQAEDVERPYVHTPCRRPHTQAMLLVASMEKEVASPWMPPEALLDQKDSSW